MSNPNCDGGRESCAKGEVRVLPLPGGAGLILCQNCLHREMWWRMERNLSLAPDCRYPIEQWDKLEVYAP